MRFGSYCFSARFLDEARLPEYKGSTFRGVFGHALRSVVCALRRRTCTDCLLTSRCLYPFVFEISPLDGNGGLGGEGEGGPQRRIAARPHPYVIEAPPGDRLRYRAAWPTTAFPILSTPSTRWARAASAAGSAGNGPGFPWCPSLLPGMSSTTVRTTGCSPETSPRILCRC